MKNWKAERNYRRIYGAHGEVTAYIITIDRQDISVSEEVFLAYSQMDAKERYQEDRKRNHNEASMDYLIECGVPETAYICGSEMSAEDEVLVCCELKRQQQLISRLSDLLFLLDPDDQLLIRSMYWESKSSRQCAEVLGISQTAVLKRQRRILKKLHDYLLEE